MELRDYQIEISDQAVNKLIEKGIVYLSMQTRTGKTITAFEIVKKCGFKSVLFVTKKKAIGSIESDLKYYKFNCVVINYESVTKHQGEYDVCIIDEAHSLGAFPKPSKRYKDLKKMVFNIPCILLSATPSPESYSQLYHQFTINKFHSWNRSRNFYDWAKYYVNKKIKYLYGREINDYSSANEDMVKKATDNYFINFSQLDAGIKKTIQERILYCDMKPETKILIGKLTKDKVIEFPQGGAVLADTPVKEMSKVHQISSGTVKLEDEGYLILDKSKAEYIQSAFKNKKIAIFYKFIAEKELLKNVFKNYTESPEDFQAGLSPIFLGQFQSAREGIRLDVADYIIFYNIDFSFLSYEQSKNRIVSKERTREAYLYFIFSRGGIEEKIYKVVKNKQDYTLSYFKSDYHGKGYTEKNNNRNGETRVVRSENNSNQQKRIPGFDVPQKRIDYFH